VGREPLRGVHQIAPDRRYCESYSGGKTPEAMDAAGFDAIVILRGAADTPTA
jgi:aldehyde:ferredoxin oxidoreductase